MLDSLKLAGKNIGRELGHAWENLSEGWRELSSRSSNALTSFAHDDTRPQSSSFPRWGLLAGEVEETDRQIVVRVEAPGMDKEDCRVTIDGNLLRLSGEKHFKRETSDSTYHVMERAYGAFERTIPLPANVDIDLAEAEYKNGVLTIRLPKTVVKTARDVPLN